MRCLRCGADLINARRRMSDEICPETNTTPIELLVCPSCGAETCSHCGKLLDRDLALEVKMWKLERMMEE